VDARLEGVPSGWEFKLGKRHRRKFTDEFKAETVKLVNQSDRSMADIAQELGISAKSIGEWVRLAEESGDSISEDERNELRRLRKENRELRMEKEILAKATAFFAKESR
jgi:transposase